MNGGVVAAIVGGVLAYGVLLTVIIYYSVRWSRGQLKKKSDAMVAGLGPQAKQLGETVKPTMYRGAETEYEINGRRVVLNTYYQNRHWIRATLRIAAGPYPWLTIYPEGKVERFGKAIGLNREVQSGDKAFDDLAYLDTLDTEENVRKAVEPAGVRGAISELLQLGYKVQLSSKGAEAFQLVRTLDAIDATKAIQAVAALGRIVDALSPFGATQLSPERPKLRAAFGAGLIFSWLVGWGVLGFCGRAIDHTVDPGMVVVAMVLGGGLAWLIYMATITTLVRGRSYAFRIVLVSGFFSLLGVPAAGGAVLLQLNKSLDASAPTERALTVLAHRRLKSDCRIIVPSWDSAPEKKLYVSHKGDDELKAGMPVIVRTHPGALGVEWIEPIAADGS